MSAVATEGPTTLRTVDDHEPVVVVPGELVGLELAVTCFTPGHVNSYHA